MAKTIFITGATSGIGQATAVRLARERHNLILTGRRGERLEKLKNELTQRYGCKVHTLCFDVRRRDEIQAAVEQLPAEWQRIDVLVNNAGLAVGLEPLHEGIADDWERMIDTNIKGLLYVTRAIASGMVGRRSGHIVNQTPLYESEKEAHPKKRTDAAATQINFNLLSIRGSM